MADLLDELQRHWGVDLPPEFRRAVSGPEAAEIGPCGLLGVDEMLDDSQRWPSMLPQFLPFGVADEGLYGLYALDDGLPVLLWNEELDSYLPAASDFGAFLRVCVLQAWAEAADNAEDDASLAAAVASLRALCGELGISAGLLDGPAPLSESDLDARILQADPRNAAAMCSLGCDHAMRGDREGAVRLLGQAVDVAPWFSDAHFLLGWAYLRQGRAAEAAQAAYRALECPVALSGRTDLYPLPDIEDDEVHPAAVALVARAGEDLLAPEQRGSALWRLVGTGDPRAFDSGRRLSLVQELQAAGDAAGAERELLNAVTLAFEPGPRARAYQCLVAFYEAAGRSRDVALCRADSRLAED